MGFIAWLVSLQSLPIAGVTDLAANLWRAIRGLWDTVNRVFRNGVAAFVGMEAKVLAWSKMVGDTLSGLGSVLWWATTVYAPSVGAWALNGAITWAGIGIGEIKRWTLNFITAGLGLLRRVVNELKAWAVANVNSLLHTIAGIIVKLEAVSKIVLSLLVHPDRLVTWFLPFLLAPLLRFIEARAVAIARWMLRKMVHAALSSVGFIESVIADVL